MLSCPHIIISEYNQSYHTSPSCYYILDLLCVIDKKEKKGKLAIGNWQLYSLAYKSMV